MSECFSFLLQSVSAQCTKAFFWWWWGGGGSSILTKEFPNKPCDDKNSPLYYFNVKTDKEHLCI